MVGRVVARLSQPRALPAWCGCPSRAPANTALALNRTPSRRHILPTFLALSRFALSGHARWMFKAQYPPFLLRRLLVEFHRSSPRPAETAEPSSVAPAVPAHRQPGPTGRSHARATSCLRHPPSSLSTPSLPSPRPAATCRTGNRRASRISSPIGWPTRCPRPSAGSGDGSSTTGSRTTPSPGNDATWQGAPRTFEGPISTVARCRARLLRTEGSGAARDRRRLVSSFRGERYRMGDYVIMPNHVHVLVTPSLGHSLREVVKGWKRFTGHQILKRTGAAAPFWLEESFDHIVPQRATVGILPGRYIRENPEKASAPSRPVDTLGGLRAADRG